MSELSSNPNGTNFSFTEARKLIGDLTKPKPWVYWVDFVTSIVLGHAALHLVFFIPRWYGWTPLAIWLLISYALTVILYMRALMFIQTRASAQEGFSVPHRMECLGGIFSRSRFFIIHTSIIIAANTML